MAYDKVLSFDTRIKNNIKNYSLDTIYDSKQVGEYLRHLSRLLGIELMLTDRHGEKSVVVGNFGTDKLDVMADPGIKVRVLDRTVAHLYIKEESIDGSREDEIREMIADTVRFLEILGEQSYKYKESSIYVDELEQMVKRSDERRHHSEKEDPLTGVLNKSYFNKRVAILDRSETVPVAIIEVNINDWKKANDKYGDEGSDRLIQIIAEIVKNESKPEYIIGRVDGDVFIVLIPIPEDGEAEAFVGRIQMACNNYEDEQLAPSVACGLVYKENVEETIDAKISDAEYLMFENKFDIKNSSDYIARANSKY